MLTSCSGAHKYDDFVLMTINDNDMTNYFTPCACSRDNEANWTVAILHDYWKANDDRLANNLNRLTIINGKGCVKVCCYP